MSPEVKALVAAMAEQTAAMTELTAAITDQTAAIAWLAKSNEALADSIVDGEADPSGDDDDGAFLDGSRRQ